jgi:hypothetical protein
LKEIVLKNYYNEKVLQMLDVFNPSPLIQTLVLFIENFNSIKGVDGCKTYSSVMHKNNNYAIYSMYDKIQDFKENDGIYSGKYYVNQIELLFECKWTKNGQEVTDDLIIKL